MEWMELSNGAYAYDEQGNDWTVRFDGYLDLGGTHMFGKGMVILCNDELMDAEPMYYNSGAIVNQFNFDANAYMAHSLEAAKEMAEIMARKAA